MENINKRSYKGQQCLHFNEFADPPKRIYLRDERGRFVSNKPTNKIEEKKKHCFKQLKLSF